ncbi:hypothetical protein [Streptomyces sp. NPDC048650]|uniref:hypothetical protein n=1 Tax=unclassified Streptomyces TaxID=2593676 RepID=UPI003713C043
MRCSVAVGGPAFSEPDAGRYENVHTVPYGTSLALPEPVGITLDTEPLKDRVS